MISTGWKMCSLLKISQSLFREHVTFRVPGIFSMFYSMNPNYSWWFQPIQKICSPNWILSPKNRGENKIPKNLGSFTTGRHKYHKFKSHLANGPWNKSLNFIFPTTYVIPKSLKFSHWPSKKFHPSLFQGLSAPSWLVDGFSPSFKNQGAYQMLHLWRPNCQANPCDRFPWYIRHLKAGVMWAT